MDILEKKYFKEVFKGHNIIQDDFEYERAKQSAEITTDVAVKFLEWCNQPVYRADGELEFRLRVQPQFPDYKEYIIIDQTGYSILPKGKFLTTHKLFNYFINNHYGK